MTTELKNEQQVQLQQEQMEVQQKTEKKDIKENLFPKTRDFDFSWFDQLIDDLDNWILNYIRHWELLFIPVKEIPKDVKKLNTNIIATWSHGHNHLYRWWELYSDDTVMYLKSKSTILYHPEHGDPETWDQFWQKSACIPDWDWKIITQDEYSTQGWVFRKVQD